MDNKKYDFLLKYIVIGDSGVGKSNIFLQFIRNIFKSTHEVTIGVEFGAKNIEYNGKIYRVQIWDTAGQETFKSITRVYYKKSACAFLVYDITKKETFENISSWMEDCIAQTPKSVTLVLVGNKKDLEEEREITYEEGKEFAEQNGIKHFIETSAKTGEGINAIFNKTVEDIANKLNGNYYDLNSDSCGVTQFMQQKDKLVISGVTKNTNKGYMDDCC